MPITVTYEEMKEARNEFNDVRMKYASIHHNYLNTILEEAGVHNKLVQLTDGTRGQFQVCIEPYFTERPWTIRFFPVRKSDGLISRKSKYVSGFYPWEETNIVSQLKNLCEVVGDLP